MAKYTADKFFISYPGTVKYTVDVIFVHNEGWDGKIHIK